jgi:DNA-binding protein H-NS
MAERSSGESPSENSDRNELSVEAKIAEVMRIVEMLDYPELLRLRDLISEAYKQETEAAKIRVIAEAQEKFEQLGLTFEGVHALLRKRKQAVRTPAMPKYRSPDGKEWSGRGATPKWIRAYEEGEWNREDYLIK